MNIGTKSVLFGAHCFFFHPWFVAAAWWKLYGFPWDPRLWVAFFVHDLGYLGKPNMDGPEGESHVELGARIMGWLFDRPRVLSRDECPSDGEFIYRMWNRKWHDFSLYHSRFYAKKDGRKPSQLCMADKLSIAMTPAWLYLPMVKATGEIREYMALAKSRNSTSDERTWYRDVQDYVRRWVQEHKDGREDTWTPSHKKPRSDSGVWQ